jgi:hypothetical protein
VIINPVSSAAIVRAPKRILEKMIAQKKLIKGGLTGNLAIHSRGGRVVIEHSGLPPLQASQSHRRRHPL